MKANVERVGRGEGVSREGFNGRRYLGRDRKRGELTGRKWVRRLIFVGLAVQNVSLENIFVLHPIFLL